MKVHLCGFQAHHTAIEAKINFIWLFNELFWNSCETQLKKYLKNSIIPQKYGYNRHSKIHTKIVN